MPKYKDKINLKHVKKNIIRSYIIGKNTIFFKRIFNNKIKFSVSKNLNRAIIKIQKDIQSSKKINKTILLSPGAASFDQYKNFEARGDKFKKLCKEYVKKFI